MSDDHNTQDIPITLETATSWARSNREWEKVYRYLFLHPKDFFVITPPRRWPIAHQVVYHGDVDLLKRILSLADEQINIRTLSADNKTLLDVATQKQNIHLAMYTYVEHLFSQDQLIEEVKQSNWRAVTDILDKNKNLANEKPPYSPYFVLHYVVQNGDAQILQDLLTRYQFLTNVLNNKNETPLDMAMRLNKHDMCTILRPKTVARPSFIHNQPDTPPAEPPYREDQPVTYHYPPSTPSDEPPKSQQPTSMPTVTPKPIDSQTKSNCIGFGRVLVDLGQDGDFTVGPNTLFNSACALPPRSQPPKTQQPSQKTNGFQHVYTKKTIVSEYPLTNLDPPSPPPSTKSSSTTEQLMKNLTCPLTKNIFVDPVIATDGQTYERSAITSWINLRHTSPITGAFMDTTFRDNTEIKGIIQSIQRQN